MKQLFIAPVAVGLSGCVASINDKDTAATDPVPPPPVPMTCNVSPVETYVGRTASTATGEAILRDSGARTLRWGPPNSAWTMDFREDRVNVRYDDKMIITGITCG